MMNAGVASMVLGFPKCSIYSVIAVYIHQMVKAAVLLNSDVVSLLGSGGTTSRPPPPSFSSFAAGHKEEEEKEKESGTGSSHMAFLICEGPQRCSLADLGSKRNS